MVAMVKGISAAEAIQAERARRSFSLFAKEAWHVIEPGRPYVGGWHLDAIAEHLQSVARGDIKRLLVNMPPRHGKSSYINVLFTTWLMLNNPAIRLLCGSYAMNLATRDNLKVRRLIKSPWFQERYGHLFQLTKDQDAKTKFETNRLGYRMAVSVGSSATGEGGDVLLLDDPHNIDEKESPAKREAALDWFDNTWSTRLNSQIDGAMIVVGQRIHEQDVSGHILDTNDGEWVHLNLPAEYEEASPCKTFLPGQRTQHEQKKDVPSRTRPDVKHTVTFVDGKAVNCTCEDRTYRAEQPCKHMRTEKAPEQETPFWQDPRAEEGQLLWPERFPQDVIDRAKRRHGPLGYAALYAQRPTPATGGTFQKQNERLFTQSPDAYFLHTPRGVKAIAKEDCTIFVDVDPAISEAQSADYMVIGVWAKTEMKDLLLLDVIRGRWPHKEQQDQVEDGFIEHDGEFVAVETVSYQHALFQDLVERGIPCRPFTPHKDKVTRASTASIWQANGKIYFLKDAHWLPELQKELYRFPKAPHDDQVDMISLASIVARSRGPLSDDTSNEDIPAAAEETGGLIPLTQPILPGQEAVAASVLTLPPKVVDPFKWAQEHGIWEGD